MRRNTKSVPKGIEEQAPVSGEKPLQSWKEIGTYLDRDGRTAQRWEKHAGLPIRRHHGGPRSTVYAYPSELDAWRAAQEPSATLNQTEGTSWRRLFPVAIGLVVIVLGGWLVFYGPIMNPPNVLVEADGITLRQVWAGSEVEDFGNLSLDGRFLTFTDWWTGDLSIRDLETEVNRRLTNKGLWSESDEYVEFPIVSPDGKQIAYAWYNREGLYELRLLDLNETEPQFLFRCEEEDYIAPLDWLPDGKRILVGLIRGSNQPEFALLSVLDQSPPVLISVGPFHDPEVTLGRWKEVALSPDGKHIVYNREPEGQSGQKDVFIVPTGGGKSTPLISHPADDYLPTWSPDGRHVLFASDRTGSTGLWMVGVEDGKPAGEPELIKADIGPLRNLIGCTRSGEIYFSLTTGMEDIYLLEMDPDSGEVLRLPAKLPGRYVGANMGPAFSPDGRYVAYHFQHGPNLLGPGALWIVIRTLDTGEERVVRTHLIQPGPVQWFQDSKSLLVAAYRSEKKRIVDYHRIDLDSGQTELIREGDSSTSSSPRPELSPDGERIFFAELQQKDSAWLFKKFEVNSGQEGIIHRIPSGKRAAGFFLSPDGKEMAWVERDNDIHSWSVCTKPVEGGVSKEVLSLEPPGWLLSRASIVWMADNRHLLVSKFTGEEGQSEILRISVDSGEVRALGISMEGIRFGDVHKDGRLVAFWSGQRKDQGKEIWALSGFLPEEGSSK